LMWHALAAPPGLRTRLAAGVESIEHGCYLTRTGTMLGQWRSRGTFFVPTLTVYVTTARAAPHVAGPRGRHSTTTPPWRACGARSTGRADRGGTTRAGTGIRRNAIELKYLARGPGSARAGARGGTQWAAGPRARARDRNIERGRMADLVLVGGDQSTTSRAAGSRAASSCAEGAGVICADRRGDRVPTSRGRARDPRPRSRCAISATGGTPRWPPSGGDHALRPHGGPVVPARPRRAYLGSSPPPRGGALRWARSCHLGFSPTSGEYEGGREVALERMATRPGGRQPRRSRHMVRRRRQGDVGLNVVTRALTVDKTTWDGLLSQRRVHRGEWTRKFRRRRPGCHRARRRLRSVDRFTQARWSTALQLSPTAKTSRASVAAEVAMQEAEEESRCLNENPTRGATCAHRRDGSRPKQGRGDRGDELVDRGVTE